MEADIGGGNQGDIAVDDFILDSFECSAGLWLFFKNPKHATIDKFSCSVSVASRLN